MENLKVKYNSTRTKLYACCPFCISAGKKPDTKYHLFITPGRAAFCFRCGYKTSYFKLTQIYRIDTSAYRGDDSVKSQSDFDVDVAKNVMEFNDSMYSQGAVNYLHKRKVDDNVIKYMHVKLGKERLFGRVVFTDDINKYYVARAFLPGVEPKTLNPKSTNRSLMCFTRAIHRTLWLVEGVFDAVPFIKTGRDVAVILGKNLSQFQLKQLQLSAINNVIIALDTDAYATAQILSGILAGALPFVNIGIMTYESGSGKDPSDYDIELFNNTSVYWTRIVDRSLMEIII